MKKVNSELEILENFIPEKGKVLIDAGCGTGFLTGLLAEKEVVL